MKQHLALEFCREQIKDISILTETHINHDQIHHIRSNCLGPIFFSLGDSHRKRLLVLLHLGLEGITEVDTDPKGRFVSFEVTPSNDRVLCVYAPSGYSTSEQLARGYFFEGLQNYMKNKSKGNENKIILGDINCTMNKMDRDGEIKHKDFIDAVLIMPCQNSPWIMGLRIYGERRTQITLSSSTTIGPLTRIQDRQGLY